MGIGTKPPRWVGSFRVRTSSNLHQQAKWLAEDQQSTLSQLARTASARYVEE
jgi:predicted HicB family RNase H-like nuclease